MSAYHSLLTMPWWKFFSVVFAGYLTLNVLFASAYILCGPGALQGGERYGRLAQSFYFSVHTFATIGFGSIVPNGDAANLVVAIEAFVGMLALALATGMLFARFSRPTARILYSERAIIAPYHGITEFEFRIANVRKNQLIDVRARIILSRFVSSGTGRKRQYYGLNLERPSVAFFPLSWTVVHPIEMNSPLYGLSPEELAESNAEFLVLLTATDETFSQTVHSRTSYRPDELIWNARFADLYEKTGPDRDLAVNMRLFHKINQV